MKFNKSLLFIILLTPVVYSQLALSAGFEKTVQWSAKQSARGGAVSSSVEGADALYFNPAGLVNKSQEKYEVSANITPTLSQFKGPIVQSHKKEAGEKTIKPPFALISSYKVREDLALGLGVYSAGGTAASFKSLDYSSQNPTFTNLKPDLLSSLSIIESSLGLGYKINKNFKVGAAYRIIHIKAEMKSASTTDLSSSGQTPDVITALHLKDIKDTKFNGYRLGFQYQTDSNNFGVGVMYRSAVKFKGKGKTAGSLYNPVLNTLTIQENDVSIENEFPQQLDTSLHYTFIPEMTLFLGYTFSEYKANKVLKVNGNLKAGATGTINREIPDIQQDWYDMHNFRIAIEDRHVPNFAFRLGYIYTTQVTNESAARATFSSPGPAHTIIGGVGTQFLKKKLDVDFAAEYSHGEGRGKTTDYIPVHGTFSSDGYSLYLSSKYRF